MVYALTIYQFISMFIPEFDSEPSLAAYKLAKGYVLAWVHGPNIALCAEEPAVLSKRTARDRGNELAEKYGVRWLG